MLLRKPTQKQAVAPAAQPGLERHELLLWEELRLRRLEISREEGVPPYVVAHDAHLLALLRRRPETLEEMLEVNGFGESKVTRYGQKFLDVLNGDMPPQTLAS
ncbi:MAG: HRDC domain-containing protein [Candidatus Eremiobacteraeota bacterium]|nr:HRDC domain-containing protein [Candidatus Eremiobacteraeota bacterium]